MVNVENLSKSYGAIQALKEISFHVRPGEIIGLLGPNGAGKTTTIKILTGYLQPGSGNVNIGGFDILNHTRQAQAIIGYLPENAPLYPELTVQDYLRMMADVRRFSTQEQPTHISEAVYATGLSDMLTRPIGQLSKGYRQRVGLAQAILHHPKLLILDEPTVGLDPTQLVEIRSLIRKLAKRSTVLFSTHILPEVETLCDRAIILLNGEIRADAQLDELAGTPDAVLRLERPVAKVSEQLAALPGAHGVEPLPGDQAGTGFLVRGEADADLCPAIYRAAREHDWPLRELRPQVRTLESVFNELATVAGAAT